MSDEKKESNVPLLKTVGGTIVAIGSTAAGFILVFRGAPISAWVTAFLIGLVAAMIVEPTALADWVLRRGSKD